MVSGMRWDLGCQRGKCATQRSISIGDLDQRRCVRTANRQPARCFDLPEVIRVLEEQFDFVHVS
jgi:hypothetical protein